MAPQFMTAFCLASQEHIAMRLGGALLHASLQLSKRAYPDQLCGKGVLALLERFCTVISNHGSCVHAGSSHGLCCWSACHAFLGSFISCPHEGCACRLCIGLGVMPFQSDCCALKGVCRGCSQLLLKLQLAVCSSSLRQSKAAVLQLPPSLQQQKPLRLAALVSTLI